MNSPPFFSDYTSNVSIAWVCCRWLPFPLCYIPCYELHFRKIVIYCRILYNIEIYGAEASDQSIFVLVSGNTEDRIYAEYTDVTTTESTVIQNYKWALNITLRPDDWYYFLPDNFVTLCVSNETHFCDAFESFVGRIMRVEQ